MVPISYATVEEFITHIVERELQNFDDAQSDEDIEKKLQGFLDSGGAALPGESAV